MSEAYDQSPANVKYAIFMNILTTAIILNTQKKKILVSKKIHRNPVAW